MKIKRIVSNMLLSNMYMVIEGNHAIIIDPCMTIGIEQNMIVDRYILTHEHIDHISGINRWKKARDAPVLCNKECAENIKDPKRNLAAYFKEFCELQTWVQLEHIPEIASDYSCTADEIFCEEFSF